MMIWIVGVITVGIFISILNNFWFSEVNPWILSAAPFYPFSPFSPNSILGYSYLTDGSIIHKENISPLIQAANFSGMATQFDVYFLRPLYPFFVNIASFFTDLKSAAQWIVYLSYGMIVVSTAFFTFTLSNSRFQSLVSGILAGIGSGAIIHLNDMSAHMLGFAVYELAVIFIYHTKVWCSRQPAQVHLAIASVLILGSISYPGGFLLTIGYTLTAIRYNSWRTVLMIAGIGIISRPLWHFILNFGYTSFFNIGPLNLLNADLGAAEKSGMESWFALLKTPTEFIKAILRPAFDCLFVLFPPLTILGLIAVFIINWKNVNRLCFFLTFLLLPYIGIIYLSQSFGARGYAIYSSSFILLSSIAVFLVPKDLQKPSTNILKIILITSLIFSQAAWSFAHYFGNFFPAFSFVNGWFLAFDPTANIQILNLSDTSPLWRFYGGEANLLEAGAISEKSFDLFSSFSKKYVFGFLLNSFILFFLYSALYGMFFLRRTYKNSFACLKKYFLYNIQNLSFLKFIALWLSTAAVVTTIGFVLPPKNVNFLNTDYTIPIKDEQTIAIKLKLSEKSITSLKNTLAEHKNLEPHLFVRALNGLVHANLVIAGYNIPMEITGPYGNQSYWQLNRNALELALSSTNEKELVLNVTMKDGWFGCWQRSITGQRESDPQLRLGNQTVFPSLELRLYNPKNRTTIFLGY